MPNPTRSKVRDIIKAKELITMLQNNVLDPNADPFNQNKLHAIKILLAKSLPDLKSIEHTGADDSKLFPESILVKYE